MIIMVKKKLQIILQLFEIGNKIKTYIYEYNISD